MPNLNITKRLQKVVEDLTLIYEDVRSLEEDAVLEECLMFILEDLRAASGEY